MKKMIAAILTALACTTPAVASDAVWTSMMVRAYHTDRTKGYNENTLGVGVEYRRDDSDIRLVGGMYNNSFNRLSTYAGVSWLPVEVGPVKMGVMGGLISGYQRYDYNFGPMAAGILSIEKNRYGANLMVVPPVPGDGAPTWTFGLQLKYRYE